MDIASPEPSERILGLVERGLEEGALGIGINAGYAPAYGQMDFALAELAGAYDSATFTHVRCASNIEPKSSFEAIKEPIRLALVYKVSKPAILDLAEAAGRHTYC